jgi:hypothetical protein
MWHFSLAYSKKYAKEKCQRTSKKNANITSFVGFFFSTSNFFLYSSKFWSSTDFSIAVDPSTYRVKPSALFFFPSVYGVGSNLLYTVYQRDRPAGADACGTSRGLFSPAA